MLIAVNGSIRRELLRHLLKTSDQKATLIEKAKSEGNRSVKVEFVTEGGKFYLLPIEFSQNQGQDYYRIVKELDFSKATQSQEIDEYNKKDLEVKMDEGENLSQAFDGIKLETNTTTTEKNDAQVSINLPKYTPASSKMWARIAIRLLEGTAATETKKISLVLNSLNDVVLQRAFVIIDESANILAKDLINKINDTSKRSGTEIKNDLDRMLPSASEPIRVTFQSINSLIKEQYPNMNHESTWQMSLLHLENALPSYVRDSAIYTLREKISHDSSEEKKSQYWNILDTLMKTAKTVNATSTENYSRNRSTSRGRWRQDRSNSRGRDGYRSKSRDSRRPNSEADIQAEAVIGDRILATDATDVQRQEAETTGKRK